MTSGERRCRERAQDQGDDEEVLAQLVGQVAHGFTDQPGAVVGRHDLDARRRAGFQILQLGLDHASIAANAFLPTERRMITPPAAIAIEFDDTTAFKEPATALAMSTQKHRRSICAGRDRDVLEILARAQIAFAAHHDLGFALLDHRALGSAIGVANGIGQVRTIDAPRGQRQRIG